MEYRLNSLNWMIHTPLQIFTYRIQSTTSSSDLLLSFSLIVLYCIVLYECSKCSQCSYLCHPSVHALILPPCLLNIMAWTCELCGKGIIHYQCLIIPRRRSRRKTNNKSRHGGKEEGEEEEEEEKKIEKNGKGKGRSSSSSRQGELCGKVNKEKALETSQKYISSILFR